MPQQSKVMLPTGPASIAAIATKIKEERDIKRAHLDPRHRYLLDLVADAVGLTSIEAEDAILDGNQLEVMDKFFEKDASKRLLFYFEQTEGDLEVPMQYHRPSIYEMSANTRDAQLGGVRPVSRKTWRLFISDGLSTALKGTCVAFTRSDVTNRVTAQNIHEEVTFFRLEAKNSSREGSLLDAAESVIGKIFIPHLLEQSGGWGEPNNVGKEATVKTTFIEKLDSFVFAISELQDCIEQTVALDKCDLFKHDRMLNLQECQAIIASSEHFKSVEESIRIWIRQIELILTQSEQVRREADNIGPRFELDHWMKRLVRFQSLLNQLRSNQVQNVIRILQIARSKILKTWQELDNRVTDATNEAKDNVKFLNILERWMSPLYNSDPVGMIEILPELVNAIRMIHSVSQYYNTSERMTSLFVKITNQMVTACKLYITNNTKSTIWSQESDVVIRKLNDCIRLNGDYQACFQKNRTTFKNFKNQPKFEFSEMYIFGKFDSFSRRASKIIEMFSLIESYSRLKDSKVEGVEIMYARFQSLHDSIRRHTYDYLDQRRQEFDEDFDDFKRSILSLRADVQNHVDDMLDQLTDVQSALHLVQRYELLQLPDLDISDKYMRVLLKYLKDIDAVTRNYQSNKDDPPIVRNLPPIAGRIVWARQLYERVHKPMERLMQHLTILQSVDGMRAIKSYNKLSRVLVNYETVYQVCWKRQAVAMLTGLNSSLLIRFDDELYINFDQEILTQLRETACMTALGLEVPEELSRLLTRHSYFSGVRDSLVVLLQENKRVRENLTRLFDTMGRVNHVLITDLNGHHPLLIKLDNMLNSGVTRLTWVSLGIEEFISDCRHVLADLQLMTSKAEDLVQHRIESILSSIDDIMLCELPETEPWSIEYFLENTHSLCRKAALYLQNCSTNMEEAVTELVEVILSRSGYDNDDDDEENDFIMDKSEIVDKDSVGSTNQYRQRRASASKTSRPSTTKTMSRPATSKLNRQRIHRENLNHAAANVYLHFSMKYLDALIRLTRSTLENLKRALNLSGLISGGYTTGDVRPDSAILRTSVKLLGPAAGLALSPNSETIQQAVNAVTRCILSVFKVVPLWNATVELKAISPDRPNTPPAADPREYDYSYVSSEQLEITSMEFEAYIGHKTSIGIPEADCQYNYHQKVYENKDVTRLVSLLMSSISSIKKEILGALDEFTNCRAVWTCDREMELNAFLKEKPELVDYGNKLTELDQLEQEMLNKPEHITIGPIAIFTDALKSGVSDEMKRWRFLYCQCMHDVYMRKMFEISDFIEEMSKRLKRPVRDLDDIRHLMRALKELRDDETRIDMLIEPIEEASQMLTRYQFPIQREHVDRTDSLRYSWTKLRSQAVDVTGLLLDKQPVFKSQLTSKVKQFRVDCARYYQDYATKGPMAEGVEPSEASDRLIVYQNRFDTLSRSYETYSGGEELFGLPVHEYPELTSIKKELALLQKLYGLYNNVIDTVTGYYDIPWVDVKIDKINSELLEFQNRCRTLPKALKEWKAYEDLRRTIDDFNATVPLLEMMNHPAMMLRHWRRIEETTKHEFDVGSESFMLKNILEAPLLEHKEDIEDICVAAVKEQEIEGKLKEVITKYSNKEFAFVMFKSRGELLLRGDSTSEVVGDMEDSLMVLSSLMSNRFNSPFKTLIQQWVQYLSNSTEILENWITVQNLWIYLEAVFVGGDIAKQLPVEAKRFSTIDKSWVKIITKAHETLNIVQCCNKDDSLRQLLPHLLEQLELCQKSLTGYLEKKRLLFPRFFFVSDPALLEILGQASNPHTIQNHLLSVFDNIKSVLFHDKQSDVILSVHSQEGETIRLSKPVKAEGNVESWLMSLLLMAHSSLHSVIRAAAQTVADPKLAILEFLKDFPAQVGLLGLQWMWTRDSTVALSNARYDSRIMLKTNQSFKDQLDSLIEKTRDDLTSEERTKFETLITIQLHQRDIFDDLCKQRIRSVTDFEWLKQTRFYYKEDMDVCSIHITDVEFVYQDEFLGCTERLVITPLTDRCYITLAQAIGMSMGGAPAGPAGTGKTETVKDMGRCLGKYVVVFNCSDQMDFRGLGRIFKGLAQSGSWGCFDEFNRIELPVLSVAAQQINIVLNCKKERKQQFVFSDGDTIDLNPEFGIFLTMNPGYAGRQELPENLKINFRSVAMMIPDRQIIIRVKLASIGFLDNMTLSCKFFILYKLCEEQLTKQVHYDFGLRNMLSVLRTLGAAKRANPSEPEEYTVMRGLRDMNLSKLVDQDEPLFLSLIQDLFPSIKLETGGYPQLDAAIRVQVEKAKLVCHQPWLLKVIQLYETQRVRHGMMVLGPSGAGKTCCIHTLMKAMTECGEPHREMRMNPKAITAPQMFGKLDVATNDWTDGIFSTLWRRTLKIKKGEHVWLVLDGPVDTLWIENLNSVLDDNKLLTLANGDRISMAPNCKIIFEPHNVDNASPATVSRNGMVFMNSSGLDWRPILQGWLNHRPAVERDLLMNLFHSSFAEIYRYAAQNLTFKMNMQEAFIIKQASDLLQGLIPAHSDEKETMISPKRRGEYERLYVFSLMWSVGALLELDDRLKIERFLRQTPSLVHLDLPKINSETDDTMFDFMINSNGEWEHWSNHVSPYDYPKNSTPEYATILVPNVDNVRTNFLLQTISKQGKAALLIGEQGTAKTVMINSFMAGYDHETYDTRALNFSSATTPLIFQRSIESYVERHMGSTYGPQAGKKMAVFIDDINMPVINEWGDQVANEIVRQLMENKGFYNLEKPGDFTNIVNLQYLAAMIQPGGGRNDIPERLKRQFSVFNCTLPSNSSIDKIFSAIGCGHYCVERGFSLPVCDMILKLVSATRRMWQTIKSKMLPTPANFHYVFNLRDLSRIWQGMINTLSEVIGDVPTLISLWKHECQRVIADRFTSFEDLKLFNQITCKVVSEELDDSLVDCVKEQKLFVDFMRDAPEVTGDEPDDFDYDMPKIYEPAESVDALRSRLEMFLQQYNEGMRGSGIDLVFFLNAMFHLTRISRIIRTPRGHALLVGVGGSGKQSLTKLASFIAGYKTFQISLSRTYNVGNLLDDLKYMYRTAGMEGKGITFIFTDQEIKEEGFLEYLNNVLSSGVVSNLFTREEVEEIHQELIPIMKREFPRRPPTIENLQEYFLSRTRKNLHVVLCFSPVGEKFRGRALKFPGLISGCTMDWFQRWPRDALVAVAEHYLSSFNVECSSEQKNQLIQIMGSIHDGVAENCLSYFDRYRRTAHVTPKSYLSFLLAYKSVYTSKRQEIDELAGRMGAGLDKLLQASRSVEELRPELIQKEKELQAANVKAEEVLKEVTMKAQAAEAIKNRVHSVKDRAQTIVDSIEADKAIASEKLEAARPALQEAEDALNTIKANDIATVRRLQHPPHLIMRIMDCVLLLFNRHIEPVVIDTDKQCVKPSWELSIQMMTKPGFLQALQDFPKDSINEETVELMQTYLDMEDYNIEVATRVCGNVAGLLSWTKAMAYFYGINKEVLPLKANLRVQEARLETANNDLRKAESTLSEKQAELDAAQAEYEKAMCEKQRLVEDADKCRRKMDTAAELISGLASERERWTIQSKEFAVQKTRLIGDVLLSTAFLSYSGPFNQDYRVMLNESWLREAKHRRIPFSSDLNIINMLTDTATISEWNLEGLPNDELSIQNGIISTQATRFPLLVDPQIQGKNWIKRSEAANELQITNLNHKYFRQHLEDALSLGRPLLIEDVNEELDPALDNVLEKNFIRIGSMFKVKVGEKEVDVLKGFRLYITTKLPNPSYTPEIFARTSLVDFTVTMKGLEDQLLGRVILTEKAELEREYVKLMEDVAANRRKIKELEDNLLYRLSSSQGSLVDDLQLVEVLNVTKMTSVEVKQKLLNATETETKINLTRDEYRQVATRASILYFLITEMSLVNPMYQTSLKQFLSLFDLAILRSQKSMLPSKRIENIIDYMTYEVFRYSVRGYYEKDKLTFTLLLALKIDMQMGKISHQDFLTFIKGGAALDLNIVQPKPAKWIADQSWLNLVELSNLHQFAGILDQIKRNEKQWRSWFDAERPEEELIPDGYQQSLDTFHRLLLVRSWCPDRTMPQARRYIRAALEDKYDEAMLLDFERIHGESDCKTPMIGLLSMGSDPTSGIEALAKRLGIEMRMLSMGQGQETHARRIISQALVSGNWVLLQNCHLSLDYVTEVMDVINNSININENFRLWVTTEVYERFPITFLQMSIKFTSEPPQGMKAGLIRSYANITQDFLEVSGSPYWKRLLFAVSFLHSIVQERRKFGPLGWNIPYEFNTSDFNASIQFIQNHLDYMEIKKGVDWNCVRYMLGEIQYGGRVTDDYDKRLLNTFCKVWFSDELFTSQFRFHQGYMIPQSGKIDDILDYIHGLPSNDSPEVFGLHGNADIIYQTKTAKSVLNSILSIQPKDSSSGLGETREAVVYRLCKDMLDKLPQDYVPFEVHRRLNLSSDDEDSKKPPPPMNIFLRQEIDCMQKVLTCVRETLQDLKLAIDGTIVMSEGLGDALDRMYDAQIPRLWRQISWESSTLGFWFTELIDRNSQIHSWCFQQRPNVFWMTGFFNAQGFLTAMRQEVTRSHKGWALDNVVLRNDVTKYFKDNITFPPNEGVYVHGLYLEGAAWDRTSSRLIEARPKMLYEPMPVILVDAVNVSAEQQQQQAVRTGYECPVYKNSKRTLQTYIASLRLKCKENPDKWTMRGVALLCDTK